LLKSLHAEGRTIVLITHDENVAQNAHRIVRLADGHIVDDSGEADEATLFSGQQRNPAFAARTMPEVAETVKMALRALKVNFFRTMLTLLGIIIGVASVVVMLAVGDGSKQKVLDQISAMGTNLLSVRPGAPGIRSSGDIATLVPDDAV